MAVSVDPMKAEQPQPVPVESPLDMPEQDFSSARPVHFKNHHWHTWLARLLTFAGALSLTVYAGVQMYLIVSQAEVTRMQWAIVALFVLTFLWIALAASASVAGVLFGGDRRASTADSKLTGKTVLVMPVYNENPLRTCAALQSMAKVLQQQGSADRFEIFMISDTNDPKVWIRETTSVACLRESLQGVMPVWYRRREDNKARKSGNVADFVTRWGGRYDYMIVLDADSLLSGEALIDLAREMDSDPDCGILQTLPTLYGGNTLFARLQQFASRVYGPVVARGITAWQGDDGNYWGHNAIIRVCAFAESAGLPALTGPKPFGGEIMSHDFVEAGLVRRAGWSVRMLPALEGSWEESPPTLADVAIRDRRWAQGNMQHLAVLPARGLRWPNRLHMLIGVMSYLASPLWLALILAGLFTTGYVAFSEFDYFAAEFSLFPTWPVFDSERMISLFILTMGILLVPKMLGLLQTLASRPLRRSMGIVRLTAGVLLEIFCSVLYAPVFMLIHSKHIWDILRGRDSGWNVQQRESSTFDWWLVIRQHASHTVVGATMAIGLAYLSPSLLLWMMPTIAGLLLAIPLSALSGNKVIAQGLRKTGLLMIPEEATMPELMRTRDDYESTLDKRLGKLDFSEIVYQEDIRLLHFSMLSSGSENETSRSGLDAKGARLKISGSTNVDEALDWMTNSEKLALLSHEDIFQELLALIGHESEEKIAIQD